ncbi:MAG: twitching motility protein PilT [Porticoccaceae bacterium]|jgi:twitching motility protein PilT|tara:strand:- start:95 stop:1225 length:1131 start_codon:yes stop_codon:yes gene_type:complete
MLSIPKSKGTTKMDITQLLALSIKEGASDLHLSAGLPPILRIDGDLVRMDLPVLKPKQVAELIHEVLNEGQLKSLQEGVEIDFSFEIPEVARFRANVFNQNRGEAAVFRSIPAAIPTLSELGLGGIFKKLALLPRGLVLITGPTGSGKSSTQAAMVDYINKNRNYHILTIEDPIEFVHESKKCLVNQREVGRDTKRFSQALRSALREDPDVVVVGEMRDLETIRLALTAAETGHLVFATLHTTSAALTINRIIDVFPAEEKDMVRSMLSDSLQAVVTQALLKKVDGGRIAAHEIMIGTPAVRNLIREDKIAQIYSVIQTSSSLQMKTLDQSLSALVDEGIISLETAREKAVSPKHISKDERNNYSVPSFPEFGSSN